jgi:hypothetical protein
MKIAVQQGFWPLRPTLTPVRLEFGCWLAAGILAVGLVTFPTPPVRPAAQTVRALGVPLAADVLAYRQHCIDRVLANDLGDTEEYVVRLINQQCSTRRLLATRPGTLACGRPLVVRFARAVRLVAGCLPG